MKTQAIARKSNVFFLGAASFFTDISSEMVFPLLPIFLTSFLGAGKEILGLIEGIADSFSSLFDIFSGYWSDISRSRKQFVIAGYSISSISKLGIAASASWPAVLFFRAAERIGKSIRTSPRDAIIAASVGKKERGAAFGLHRAMDSAGAIAGPLLAYLLLSFLGQSEEAYRSVFFAALLPAFAAVAIIWLFVSQPKMKPVRQEAGKSLAGFLGSLGSFPASYKRFLLVSFAFSLSYFSFAFLILQASNAGILAKDILLIYALFNIAYMVSSVPAGQLSDKIGRKPLIAASFFLYAFLLAGFAFASDFFGMAALFLLYGVFVAIDESVSKAYISDIVSDKSRGAALGIYNSAVGLAYLPASVIFGALWSAFGSAFAFEAASALAFASGVAFIFLESQTKPFINPTFILL
jgi:MFS family permease